jgi:hypothetical protein
MERVGEARPIEIRDRLDREVARVEIERAAAGRAKQERRVGCDRLRREVDLRDPRERFGLDLRVIIVGVRIAARHACILIAR